MATTTKTTSKATKTTKPCRRCDGVGKYGGAEIYGTCYLCHGTGRAFTKKERALLEAIISMHEYISCIDSAAKELTRITDDQTAYLLNPRHRTSRAARDDHYGQSAQIVERHLVEATASARTWAHAVDVAWDALADAPAARSEIRALSLLFRIGGPGMSCYG